MRAEGSTHRAHAQHNVQVVAHTVDAEVVDGVPVALGDAQLFGGWATSNDQLFVLVRFEEIWHLARV